MVHRDFVKDLTTVTRNSDECFQNSIKNLFEQLSGGNWIIGDQTEEGFVSDGNSAKKYLISVTVLL